MAPSKVIHMAGTTYAKVPGGVVRTQPPKFARNAIKRSGKPTKALKRAVNTLINRKSETKYVGEDILAPTVVLSGFVTPAQLLRMLPNLTQGVGENQRLGDKINPVRANTYFSVFLNGANVNFLDVTLHLIILQVKGAGNAAAVAAVPAGQLLKGGNGVNADPDSAVYTQPQFITHVNHYPINTEQYTVVKHIKRRFAKGSYDINGVPGANATSQIAVARPMVVFKHSWKPPALKYNTAGNTLPTNHYPVYGIYCTTNDGGAYAGTLSYGVRSDLYFKDE